MKKILVSGCLYGWNVRYDGRDIPCLDKRFLKWKEEGRLIPFCPEVFGGLETPRPDSQRVDGKILTRTGLDVTEEFLKGAVEMARLAKENKIAFAIMKENSPSCGSNFIYDGSFTDIKIPGEGLAAEILRKEGFIVFSENQIDEAEKMLEEME